MIRYTAIALNREQKKTLAQGTLNECRDAIHRHSAKESHPSLVWATSYHQLVALTEDSENPLSPFIIRYQIEVTYDSV